MFERARRALTKAGPERAAAFVLACLTVVVPSLSGVVSIVAG